MGEYLKIFLAGWVILAAAIILNVFEVKLGISTWYSFLQEIERNGLIKAFNNASHISKVFLFIIYPFLLGLVGFILFKK